MKPLVRLLLVCVFAAFAAVCAAQETRTLVNEAEPLYPLWEDVANAAEETVDDPDSTNTQLEKLRANIVEFRAEFSDARGANADRIKTLEEQLIALGPVPANGAESLEVATTRAELENRLEALRAPARVAEAAFRRAEGLVSEIDTIIRERQARRLLSLGPSPFDLRNLPVFLEDTRRMMTDIAQESYGLTQRITSRNMIERLPLFAILVIVSSTLILKGPAWAARGVDYMRRFGGRGSGVWSFLVSLLRILLPLAGLLLLTHAIRMTGVFGPIIERLLAILPLIGLLILGFRWSHEHLFSADEDVALIALASDKRKAARFYMLMLSILFVVWVIIDGLFALENARPETVAVLNFPIVALMGATLAIFGSKLRKLEPAQQSSETGAEEEQQDAPASMERVVRVCGGLMIAIGVVAPTMAAIGYAEAGNALLVPTVISLLLLGLVLIFQRFLTEVYGLVTGQGATARDGLMAIFFWFVLFIASLPVFALIWGARVSDLTEIWTQFLQGFDIGGTRIAPSNFLAFAIFFSIGLGVTRLIQSTLRSQVLPKTKIDIGGQNAIISGVRYVGITLAALVAVTVAGLDLSGLAIVAGALSVGIGFGLQTIVSNFVSGIILLIERPISEGDWIEVGGQMGYVRDISVRSTRIETFDRTDVIIPNSDLISGSVTNYTRGNTIGRLILKVGVAYGTDTRKVEKILREIAQAQPIVMRKPPPNVLFMGFGADSLDFEIRAILRDVNWVLNVRNDINHEIAKRFAEEGIEIPFAQRDVWLRNPETLRNGTGTDQ